MTAAVRCRAPRCNRLLKTEESRERGYGPVCHRREFGPPPRPPRAPKPTSSQDIPLFDLERTPMAEEPKPAFPGDIDTIARHLIRQALGQAIEFENIGWEDYGELREADYEAAVKRAEEIGDQIKPLEAEYEMAYSRLSELAGD